MELCTYGIQSYIVARESLNLADFSEGKGFIFLVVVCEIQNWNMNSKMDKREEIKRAVLFLANT